MHTEIKGSGNTIETHHLQFDNVSSHWSVEDMPKARFKASLVLKRHARRFCCLFWRQNCTTPYIHAKLKRVLQSQSPRNNSPTNRQLALALPSSHTWHFGKARNAACRLRDLQVQETCCVIEFDIVVVKQVSRARTLHLNGAATSYPGLFPKTEGPN